MGTVANTEVVNSLGGAVVEVLPVGGVVVLGGGVVVPVVLPVLGGGSVGVVPVPVGGVIMVGGGVVILVGGAVEVPGAVVPGFVVLAITWVKTAVQLLFPVILTCPLAQSPLQLPNCQPAAGIVLKFTIASC